MDAGILSVMASPRPWSFAPASVLGLQCRVHDITVRTVALVPLISDDQASVDFRVSRYPLATASPGSGRNWALCAAAYIACWLISVLVIFVLYELVYSFARKWRVREYPFPIHIKNFTD